ncbi:MAG TPA: amidohydrolase family protein, partial [Candidatus Binataceae bacterium]|nr:amidohydrolase family protein [Candidatus Binataceae bacterium]
MQKPIISADSHITEPPGAYVDRIDRKYKDSAPHVVRDDKMGDVFVVKDMERSIPMGLLSAAGKSAKELARGGVKFEEMHRGGWDPEARLGDQDRDGVAAEIIYPTVGMVLCNHPDFDYKKACFDAYNLWMAEYCGRHPARLIGMGQTAMRSPAEGIEDLRKMKELGFKGVMMPGNPALEDYDSLAYDDFYRAAVDLEMPLSFHILTSRN